MSIENKPINYTFQAVGTALVHYSGASGEVNTVRTVIKKLHPNTETMPAGEFQTFLNQLPVDGLRKFVGAGDFGWSQQTKADLQARYPGDRTLLERYPGVLIRFIKFIEMNGAPVGEDVILPEWEHLVTLGIGLLPAGVKGLERLVKAGATTYLGGAYPIDVDNVAGTMNKVYNMRSALRGLARRCSSAGLPPRGFAEQVLDPSREEDPEDFAGQNIYYSYCRTLWNTIIEHNPGLDLPHWADRRQFIGKPESEWPSAIREGLDQAIFDRTSRKSLAAVSVKGYLTQFAGGFGLLEREGYNLGDIVSDLAPKDAMRLVFGGWPRWAMSSNAEADAPLALYRRVLDDPEFRQRIVDAIGDQEGDVPGRKLVENPFMAVILNARFARGTYGAADSFLDRVFNINKEYLALGEGNRRWIVDLFKKLDDLSEDADTPYDEKKEVVFGHPYLYEDVLARAKELAETVGARHKQRGKLWATHVRDLVYLSLVTLYPLRVKNHRLMKLGENYNPDSHVINIHKRDVKNKKRILFELPDAGYNAWVRPLIELYLNEARPILLAGSDSDYFYVVGANNLAPPQAAAEQESGAAA